MGLRVRDQNTRLSSQREKVLIGFEILMISCIKFSEEKMVSRRFLDSKAYNSTAIYSSDLLLFELKGIPLKNIFDGTVGLQSH